MELCLYILTTNKIMCTIHNRKANACPKDRQERKEVIPIMASTKEIFDKKGKRCFHITVSRGHGEKPFSKTWYPSEKWSEKTVHRKLKQAAFEFESKCKAEQSERTAKKKTHTEEFGMCLFYTYSELQTTFFTYNSQTFFDN